MAALFATHPKVTKYYLKGANREIATAMYEILSDVDTDERLRTAFDKWDEASTVLGPHLGDERHQRELKDAMRYEREELYEKKIKHIERHKEQLRYLTAAAEHYKKLIETAETPEKKEEAHKAEEKKEVKEVTEEPKGEQ